MICGTSGDICKETYRQSSPLVTVITEDQVLVNLTTNSIAYAQEYALFCRMSGALMTLIELLIKDTGSYKQNYKMANC